LDQIKTPSFHWAPPVTAAGADLLALVPAELDRPQNVTTLDLDATQGLDVPARAKGEERFEGDAALVWRVGLGQMPPEQRDRALKEYWHRQYDFVTADTVAAIDDPATGAYRLTMMGTAKMDWSKYGGRRWYEVDGARIGFKLDTMREPGPNRDAPFAVDFPSWSESRQTVLLPNKGAGFNVDGGDVDRTVAAYQFHRSTKLDGAKLTMVASTRALAPEIAFKDAETAKTTLASMNERGVSVGTPGNYRPNDTELAALKATTPTTAEEFDDRGNILLDRSEYAAALKDFDAAIALKRDLAIAHGLRALALAWLHDPRAEAAAARALALDPKEFRAWNARMVVAGTAARHADAEQAATHSLEIWPEDAFALSFRAYNRAELGRYIEALVDVDAGLKIAPDDPWLMNERVLIGMQAGKPQDTLAFVELALKSKPADVGARHAARATGAQGRGQEGDRRSGCRATHR